MKANTVWVLIAGLAVGFLIGRELPRGGGGSSTPSDGTTTAAKAGTAAQGGETTIPPTWITEDQFKASDQFAGLTPHQRYLVLKVMNEKPCDCGCSHGTTAGCAKEDPGCPRHPQILKTAISEAKAGKTFDQIMAAVKKPDAPSGGQQAQPSQFQKVEVAKWSPIEGPKLAKVTIVEFSDFQ